MLDASEVVLLVVIGVDAHRSASLLRCAEALDAETAARVCDVEQLVWVGRAARPLDNAALRPDVACVDIEAVAAPLILQLVQAVTFVVEGPFLPGVYWTAVPLDDAAEELDFLRIGVKAHSIGGGVLINGA